MDEWYWAILIAANTPLYVLIGWIVFDGWEGFLECVRFWLTPDIFSALRGEYVDDIWGELKLFYFLILCAGLVFAEHILLTRYILT